MNVTFAQVSGWVVRYLLTIRISDILDIAIMAFVLYKIFTLVQSTKAASLVKGLLIFLAALVLSSFLHLNGINYIMSRMVNLGLLALIIAAAVILFTRLRWNEKSYLLVISCESGALASVEALLATGQSGSDKVAPLDPETVAWLEGRIDAMQEVLKPIDKFTIPGGNAVVSMCHVCRTVCRRAERAALRADARYGVDSTALVWLNRLDDLTILSIQCPFIKNPGRIILIIYHFKCADFSIFQHFQHKLCMNRHPRCTEIPVRFFFCSVTILIVRNGLFRNLIINLCSL